MELLQFFECFEIHINDITESNVYNLYKPPRLSIVGSLPGHPSTSDSLYQTESFQTQASSAYPEKEPNT